MLFFPSSSFSFYFSSSHLSQSVLPVQFLPLLLSSFLHRVLSWKGFISFPISSFQSCSVTSSLAFDTYSHWAFERADGDEEKNIKNDSPLEKKKRDLHFPRQIEWFKMSPVNLVTYFTRFISRAIRVRSYVLCHLNLDLNFLLVLFLLLLVQL